MSFTISGKLDGLDAVLGRLEGVERKLRRVILRKAITAAAKPVLAAAKANTRVGASGLSRRALAKKIKLYRKGGIAVGLVGPQTGFRKTRSGRVRTALGKRYQEADRNPSKTFHLLELGRKAIAAIKKKVLSDGDRVFGKSVRAVAGEHPLGRAWDANKSSAVATFIQVVTDELDKAARGQGVSE